MYLVIVLYELTQMHVVNGKLDNLKLNTTVYIGKDNF